MAISASLLFYPAPTQAECLVEWASPECDDSNHFNGYWAWNKRWVPGYVSNSTWFKPAPIVSRGNATFYAPWIMEATAEYRGFDLSNYVDGIALMSPADIGAEVWLKPPGGDWEGPFLVVDCARRGDIWPVINYYGEVVELGFKTAERWGMAERYSPWKAIRWKEYGVLVSKVPPSSVNRYKIVDYPDWWLEQVEFTYRREPRPIYRYPSTWRINGEWHTFNVQPICPDPNSVLELVRYYVKLTRREIE